MAVGDTIRKKSGTKLYPYNTEEPKKILFGTISFEYYTDSDLEDAFYNLKEALAKLNEIGSAHANYTAQSSGEIG